MQVLSEIEIFGGPTGASTQPASGIITTSVTGQTNYLITPPVGPSTPGPTALDVILTGGAPAPAALTVFGVTSVGGQSTISGFNFANPGTNLAVTTYGVPAWTNLNDSSYGFGYTSNFGYQILSTGGGGSLSSNVSGADGGSASLAYTQTQTPVFVGGQPTQAQALPWLIPSTGIQVSSVGGAGSVSGGTSLVAGGGGSGASVSIAPAGDNEDLVITLGNTAIPLTALPTAPVAGIAATSLGAPGAVCCVVSNGVYSPVTVDSDPSQISPGLGGGPNGSGGPVAVQLSGSITGSSSNLYGIIGASVGASTQIPTSYSPGSNNKASSSGTGGPVSVSLTDGQINLSGANSVGVFAASLSDQVIIPDGMVLLGTGNTAGAVDVSLDAQSSISLGSGSTTGQFSAGVVAISSTGWLFQPVGAAVNGAVTAGNGGNISVSNAGSITVSQNASAGIAALSLGNGGLLINAPASVTGVNYVSNSNAGAAGSNTGGSVTITNSGTLSVNGDSAIGVLAASNGTGGLVAGIPDATFGSSATNAQNIFIGSAPSGVVAGAGDSTFTAPGGSVSVTNSGTIQTTGGASAGNMAIGVLAQSVGGAEPPTPKGWPYMSGMPGGVAATEARSRSRTAA